MAHDCGTRGKATFAAQPRARGDSNLGTDTSQRRTRVVAREKMPATREARWRLARQSEREPVAPVAVHLVVRVYTCAQSETGPHRRERHAARTHVVHTEAGNEVEAALNAGKSLIKTALLPQIVHQREHLGGIAAEIESDRRAFPVDLYGFEALAHEPARSIANTGNESA